MSSKPAAKLSSNPDDPNPRGEAPEKKFKRGRALALPTLSTKSMKEGDSLNVELVSVPVTKEQKDKSGKPKVDPDTGEVLTITTVQARDLKRGVTGELVLGFVVVKSLAEFYPNPEDLKGKRFEFLKGEKKNRTIMWEVYELEEYELEE